MTSFRSPKATTCAILERESKIIMTKRTVSPFKGSWCIPGGHIMIGEKARDAIIREVKRERGLNFNPKYFAHFDEIFPELYWYSVLLVFYGIPEGEVVPNEEVSEWKWLSPKDALLLDLAFSNKEIIESWIKEGA